MDAETSLPTRRQMWIGIGKRVLLFLSVFGPATITAMADNDAAGVATYSIGGAKLGYPVLFLLLPITILLAVTQEMGMRLSIITRRGLADLIREKFGVRVSLFIFGALLIANMGTIIVDMSAIRTTSQMLSLPVVPSLIVMIVVIFIFITKGNYKLTQSIMLLSSLFYLTYIISAVKSGPDWGLALSNLLFPHGVAFTAEYIRNYVIIGLGVLGTTITPWGQFFISSFAFDKRIEPGKVKFSQLETYVGAFLTDFFSFFMIVATAATLFIHNIPIDSGENAARAIEPFAGKLAGSLFAVGILNAGFMGVVVISLSTAYAFTEFFGISGGLNTTYKQSKTFYIVFLSQLIVAALATFIPGVSLFNLAIAAQALNATMLPLVFLFLIRLTNNKPLMKEYANNNFQKYFSIVCTIVIFISSMLALASALFGGRR